MSRSAHSEHTERSDPQCIACHREDNAELAEREPWEVSTKGGFVLVMGAVRAWDDKGTPRKYRPVVCNVGIASPQHEADARLIAAAPEMYEDLKTFVEYYSDHHPDRLGNGEARQHFDRASALLAKIDGA